MKILVKMLALLMQAFGMHLPVGERTREDITTRFADMLASTNMGMVMSLLTRWLVSCVSASRRRFQGLLKFSNLSWALLRPVRLSYQLLQFLKLYY